MPKEIIYSRHFGTNENPEPTVHVGWTREASHVEIATRMPKGIQLPCDDVVENGWYATLDRNGINQLIRALRKARDQAFGKDE